MIRAFAIARDDVRAVLITAADFGCTQWAAKEDSDEAPQESAGERG